MACTNHGDDSGVVMTIVSAHPQVYPVLEDTLLLLDAALAELRSDDRVLEVGTGSGHVAGALPGRCARIVAIDINPYAALAARDRGLDVIRTDLFAGIKGSFDLVLFNPPYLPTSLEERRDDWLEFALDGGPDGRRCISQFLAGLDSALATGGRALLVVSSLTDPHEVIRLADASGMRGLVVLERRVEDEVLCVIRVERRDADD